MKDAVIRDISQLEAGQEYTMSVTLGENVVDAFIGLTGDHAPVHVDASFAAAKGYDGRIAHGLLVGSFYSTILGCHLPGPNTVIGRVTLEMVAPVYVGDTLQYTVRVDKISEAVNTVMLVMSAANQNGATVNRGTAMCVFK